MSLTNTLIALLLWRLRAMKRDAERVIPNSENRNIDMLIVTIEALEDFVRFGRRGRI